MSRRTQTIAIDARVAQAASSGVASYARSLIPHLAEMQDVKWMFVVDRTLPYEHIQFPNASDLLFTSIGRSSWMRRDVWEQFILPRILSARCVSLYHGVDYSVPFVQTSFARVATFHDAIVFSEHDDRSILSRARSQFLMRQVARSADAIITDSDVSARELRRLLPALNDKLETIWSGIDDAFFTATDLGALKTISLLLGERSPFVLYYGGFAKRKNVALLLQAFAQLTHPAELRMVLVGPHGDDANALRTLARSLGIEHRTIFYGTAPQEELKALLEQCRLFVFPSEAEGFGLPVAEAMAVGAPVVCSPNGSLAEVAGEAAVYAETRVEVLAAAMQLVAGDAALRRDLRARGKARSELFKWSHSVRLLERVYARTLRAC